MAWGGYFEYGGGQRPDGSELRGIEIFNVHRVGNYASRYSIEWFKGCGFNDQLGCLLGCDSDYLNPVSDEAPWIDPDVNDSADFLGAWLIDVTGIEDSTREANVTESTSDGGVPGRIRHRTRTMVFQAMLIANSSCGVEYGFQWLKRSLASPLCGDGCDGGDLVYLSCEPCIECVHCGQEDVVSYAYTPAPTPEDPDAVIVTEAVVPGTDMDAGTDVDECLLPYLRTLHNVTFTNGPVVDAKYEMSDGAHMWLVTMTAVAGDPFEHGEPVAIVEDFMGPDADPYAEGVEGDADEVGSSYVDDPDSDCSQVTYQPMYDPDCIPVALPPGVPTVPLNCYTPPATWQRRKFTVGKEYIPTYSEQDAVIRLTAQVNTRNVRIRFYEDFFGKGQPEDEPCGYCADFVITYIPAGATLVIDGEYRTVYVIESSGIVRRGDSLVIATDSSPFTWPTLTCGAGYVVTVDMPRSLTQLPSMALSLVGRAN